jgi:drug/metabolite transporter (DMT)-like permease
MRQAGLAWGLLAALAYAVMNLCLRAAAVHVDPFVGSLVRMVPVWLAGCALLAWEGRHGAGWRWPGWRAVTPLLLVGVLFNVVGNSAYLVALALGGLALGVAVSQSAVIWGGVAAGRGLMGERVTGRMVVGLLALVAALPLLSLGAEGGGPGPVWLAVATAALAGACWGGGNAVMRQTVLVHRLTSGQALVPVATAGLVGLLAVVLARPGLAAQTALDGPTTGWLLLAGLANAVALTAVARALQLLPVARVNALTTLQTALAAAGGVLIFAEPPTGALLLGLLLSLLGTVLVQRGHQRPMKHED